MRQRIELHALFRYRAKLLAFDAQPVQIAAILRFLVELVAPSRPPDGHVIASEFVQVRPGQQVELSVTILDSPVSDLPIELRLASETLKLDENRFGNDDIVDPLATQPRISIRVTAPQDSGRYTLVGHLTYVTCHAHRCRMRRAEPRWEMEVRAP